VRDCVKGFTEVQIDGIIAKIRSFLSLLGEIRSQFVDKWQIHFSFIPSGFNKQMKISYHP